jgi:hypothetical protein
MLPREILRHAPPQLLRDYAARLRSEAAAIEHMARDAERQRHAAAGRRAAAATLRELVRRHVDSGHPRAAAVASIAAAAGERPERIAAMWDREARRAAAEAREARDAAVRAMRAAGASLADTAAAFGLHPVTVSRIANRKTAADGDFLPIAAE